VPEIRGNDFYMRVEDYEQMYRLESVLWWYAAMRRITDAVMRTELQTPGIRILDAGCGTGYNVHYYSAAKNRTVFGLDIADAAIECVKRKGLNTVAQASVTAIPFRSNSFDLVFSFEVITHVKRSLHDDAFREMHRVLKPGGSLFLRLPAFMWLWSSHDEAIEAYYRYTKPEAEEKLSKAGYRIEWISYANSFLFPVILLHRFLKHFGIAGGSDVRSFPRGLGWLELLFQRMLESEAKWFQRGRCFPFGLSLICRAKKV
jgi:ubiquinone/menaquinone biosynthesis C-methylase UbiE